MMLGSGSDPDGFLILNKPAGQTSYRVLREVARYFGPKTKAGHAGTLDSFATGVLVCLFGRYTRLSDYFMAAHKAYRATIHFGLETDTLDPEGQIIRRADLPSLAAVQRSLAQFRGQIQQVPPAYSALHVDGKRAYERVRQGEILQMKSRAVDISRLELICFDQDKAIIEVNCSKGTYIRALARDIGAASGSCAYLSALCRTASGSFSLDEAIELPALSTDRNILRSLTPALAADLGYGCRFLSGQAARDFTHGLPLSRLAFENPLPLLQTGSSLMIFDDKQKFLGIIRMVAERSWSYAFVCAETR